MDVLPTSFVKAVVSVPLKSCIDSIEFVRASLFPTMRQLRSCGLNQWFYTPGASIPQKKCWNYTVVFYVDKSMSLREFSRRFKEAISLSPYKPDVAVALKENDTPFPDSVAYFGSRETARMFEWLSIYDTEFARAFIESVEGVEDSVFIRMVLSSLAVRLKELLHPSEICPALENWTKVLAGFLPRNGRDPWLEAKDWSEIIFRDDKALNSWVSRLIQYPSREKACSLDFFQVYINRLRIISLGLKSSRLRFSAQAPRTFLTMRYGFHIPLLRQGISNDREIAFNALLHSVWSRFPG